MSAAVEEKLEFNKTDRCDRCGAQAMSFFEKEMYWLMFCQHHANEFEPALLKAKWLAK